ncbi:MAG: sulfite exporter TauE/SafE family protein [Mariprofundaceae bacterium]|nr:sulfite exporter TauE/SafE family protein [Mariprofundaceae bacterium]
MMELLLAAFLVGFLGSMHCVGMCGGLVTTLSMSRSKIWWTGLMAYQAGRIATYTLLGFLVSMLGVMLLQVAWFADGQRFLTLLAGMLMIIFGLTLAGWLPDFMARMLSALSQWLGLMRWLQRAASSRMPMSWFMVGLLNGLLPCGLVYAGLALSMASGDVLLGAAMMLAFGLGTVPAMSVVPVVLRSASPKLRGRLLKVAAILLIMLGVLTLLRGSDWMHVLHGADHAGHGQDMMQHDMPQHTMPSDMNMLDMEMP